MTTETDSSEPKQSKSTMIVVLRWIVLFDIVVAIALTIFGLVSFETSPENGATLLRWAALIGGAGVLYFGYSFYLASYAKKRAAASD